MLLIYLAFNITGTVYYALPSLLPSLGQKVPAAEKHWDLASVIIGWVVPPLAPVNLSSPLSYAVTQLRWRDPSKTFFSIYVSNDTLWQHDADRCAAR